MRWLAIIVVLACGLAYADEDPSAEAKRLFDSGRRHFDLTEYDAALEDFKSGYRIKDDAVFLYNIGLCHRLLDHKLEALRFFKSYLSKRPDAPNREDVERKIAALDEEIAAEARARAAAQADNSPPPSDSSVRVSAAPPPPRPVYKKWWLWTSIGVVAAVGLGVGLGVGLASGAPASSRYDFPRIQF